MATSSSPSTSNKSRVSDKYDSTDHSNRKKSVLEAHGYILGGTIGNGSYATVKIAKSERHESQVAIKIVSKFHAPSDYLMKFLPREIDVVKGLKHPNLIRFLQAIETTHRVYIIMEYAHNGSLLDIIRRDTYIDEIRSRHWFTQLLEALGYCHSRGVVHRDIKCENLLMDQHLNIKLSDFGFARGQMNSDEKSIILSETFCGSYAYASPEILRGIPYQPQLSDVWSLGVVLYAMVCGRLPFDDKNYGQLLKQVQNTVKFPKLPKISHACRLIILRMLASQDSRAKVEQLKNDDWIVAAVVSDSKTSKATTSSDSPTKSPEKTSEPGEHEIVGQFALLDEQLHHKKMDR